MAGRHGFRSTYKRGCHCRACTDANNAYKARRQAVLRAQPFESVPHGTLSGYVRYKCRCEACRVFYKDYQAAWRAAREGVG